MINLVNNISFKAVYVPKFSKFSETQQKVHDDIKNKLKDKKNNFLNLSTMERSKKVKKKKKKN